MRPQNMEKMWRIRPRSGRSTNPPLPQPKPKKKEKKGGHQLKTQDALAALVRAPWYGRVEDSLAVRATVRRDIGRARSITI
jgi:hypothetical protein